MNTILSMAGDYETYADFVTVEPGDGREWRDTELDLVLSFSGVIDKDGAQLVVPDASVLRIADCLETGMRALYAEIDGVPHFIKVSR